MDKNSREQLEILLNDYYNSEKSLYLNLKNKLLNGIELTYSGPQIVRITNENEMFDFIKTISNKDISVGYEISPLDHNYKLLFFSDDIIHLQVFDDTNVVFDKKFSLTAYNTYSVNKTFPTLIGNKTNYRVCLKLLKINHERNEFEQNCIDDCDKTAIDYVKDLYKSLCGWKTDKSIETENPRIFNLLQERMKLFNFTINNDRDLMNSLDNLRMSDLGIKDIVKLSYLIDLVFNSDLSNDEMFQEFNNVLLTRKIQYEELCQKIKI